MTTCECMHLVTDSSSSHVTRQLSCHSIGCSRKYHAADTLYRSTCYRRGVIGGGTFTPWGCRFPLREYWMAVDLFCSCDLDPM